MVILIIGIGMTIILMHERQRIRYIETETEELRQLQRNIGIVHQNIIIIATMGEGIVDWEEADYLQYHTQRLQTDSLLRTIKPYCVNYVQTQQIDSLRTLLADKEGHLQHIMSVFERQKEADSLLINHLPEVARRATRVRTIQQKKKGIAGFFCGKKTVQVLPSAKELATASWRQHCSVSDVPRCTTRYDCTI